MKNTKIVLSTFAVLVVIVVIVLITSNRKSTEMIKIGALYPLTGGLVSYGEPAQSVARIAVDDINATGGINGKRLELDVEDHKCDPKTAVSAFEKLSSVDDIHIFTSIACTGTVVSIVPGLQAKDAVLLGTITSGNKLTGISPLFFRNWASDNQESKLLADQILKKGYKNVAVMYEETDYAKGLVISMEGYLKDSPVKITSESFVSDSTDVRSQLTKLQALKPDAVFVSVQTVTSGEIVLSQIEQLGWKPAAMLINDNILKATALVTKHAGLLEGAIGGDYTFPATGGLNDVLAKYKARYGSDCPQVNICAAEYDAIQLLAQAIKNSDGSATGVKTYLNTVVYNGVSGNISFDSNNDRSNATYSLFVIKSGQVSLLK